MSEPAAEPIQVANHLFCQSEQDEIGRGRIPLNSKNGLVASRPGLATVITGAGSGLVSVSVEPLPTPPKDVDLEDWEEVVDHSMEIMEGNLLVVPLMADQRPSLPSLTPFGVGSYRLRVHAAGRDTAPDAVAFDPHEAYLIMAWPAPYEPDRVHKQTDVYGSGWRRASVSPLEAEKSSGDSVSSSANSNWWYSARTLLNACDTIWLTLVGRLDSLVDQHEELITVEYPVVPVEGIEALRSCLGDLCSWDHAGARSVCTGYAGGQMLAGYLSPVEGTVPRVGRRSFPRLGRGFDAGAGALVGGAERVLVAAVLGSGRG